MNLRIRKFWYRAAKLFYHVTGIRPSSRRTPNPLQRGIQDPVIHLLSPDAYFAVYWKRGDAGQCPGVSFYLFDEEILRFDCFGYPHGHYLTHLNDPKRRKRHMQDRFLFMEKTIEEQIERTCYELRTNLNAYLRGNPNPRVQAYQVDSQAIADAVPEIREIMNGYIQKTQGMLF